jgi:hypothetical protein
MNFNYNFSYSQYSFSSQSVVGNFVNSAHAHQSKSAYSNYFASSFQKHSPSGFEKIFSGILQNIFKQPPMLPFFGPANFPGHHGPIRPQPGGNGGINPGETIDNPILMRYGINVPRDPDPTPIKMVYGILVKDSEFA